MPRSNRCSTTDAAAYLGLRVSAATGLPMVSMIVSPWLSALQCCSSRIAARLLDGWSLLDAGEGGLLFFAMTFDGEGDEAVDQLFVGNACGLP